MKKHLKTILLVLVIACLAFFIRATNWTEVADSIRLVGFNFLFILFVTFISAWFGVLGWRFCLPNAGADVSAWQLFWIRMIGENVAILNPTSIIGGEATKIYMLRELGVEQRPALHSIVLSRTIMILSQILMLLIAVIAFLVFGSVRVEWSVANTYTVLKFLPIVPVLILLLRSKVAKTALRRLLSGMGLLERAAKARAFLLELWRDLRQFYRENRAAMLLSFVYCCLHWVLGAMEFYYILLFLGIKTSLAKALLIDMGVIVFKTAGVFVPAQIGVEEYGNKVMLGIIGVASSTIWITVSILRRTRQLCWILVGLVVYLLFYRKQGAKIQEF